MFVVPLGGLDNISPMAIVSLVLFLVYVGSGISTEKKSIGLIGVYLD
jgi:hypothetical protein